MNLSLKIRLAAMMFLQYLVPGATVPILTLYLKDSLGFTAYQSGVVMAMPAIAAIAAPLAVSRLADRIFSAERMLVWCHLLSGILMLLLSRIHSYPAFVALYFVYGVTFTPTFGLTNAVALHHVENARRDFGGIRLWGTMGWMVIAWLFGYFWLRGASGEGRLPDALPLSGGSSLLLALFAFICIPPGAAHGTAVPIRYREVLRIFLKPDMLLLCALTLLTSACHQFYYYGMSPFLHHISVPGRFIMPAMSLGQASEVVVLGIIGWCLLRLRMKTAMFLGVAAQGLRMLIFAFTEHPLPVLAGISLHGFCYAFFFTTGYLYVEAHSTRETRAGAQQILTIMIAGAGTLAGFWGAGWTAQACTDPATGLLDFRTFWLTPAVVCALVALALLAGFRERKPEG